MPLICAPSSTRHPPVTQPAATTTQEVTQPVTDVADFELYGDDKMEIMRNLSESLRTRLDFDNEVGCVRRGLRTLLQG